ncbi:YqaJ viral recombinase family protein [Streptomyces sp. UH6]|uniref:YqaJ viral recombinase family nuclease n=1 Tax=Streptomyces sp. UH6 TaxID=2748379 RepID=UPI0015D4E75C|nr:YqaJ viral recombinase family protein [Streptomyces sp. UH6]NYV73112.1 YqaJ viral recombinase family protein [Streptomyces sp. UH6]
MPTTTTAPTGVLLGNFTPGTPEWNAARTGLSVTATEIAAIVGLSPWMSRYELWHKKSGLPTPPFQMTSAIEWGNRLEDVVAQKWADEHEGYCIEQAGTWRHTDREWQRATPDRLLTTGRGQTVELLELKTSPQGDGWGPSGSDEIPIYYRCQVQWQLSTLGLDTCHVAVLISGHDYREYVIDRDDEDAATLVKAAAEFLDTVRRGQVPDIDGSSHTYDTVRLQPDRYDPVDVEIPGPIAADYEVCGQQYKAAADEYTRAKSQLLTALGTGKNAIHLGRRIAYRIADETGATKSLQPAR